MQAILITGMADVQGGLFLISGCGKSIIRSGFRMYPANKLGRKPNELQLSRRRHERTRPTSWKNVYQRADPRHGRLAEEDAQLRIQIADLAKGRLEAGGLAV